MKKTFVAILGSVLLSASLALGAVDWEPEASLKLEAGPRDVAVSADGQKIFVLTDAGKVGVYSPEGRLLGTLELGGAPDRIELSLQGDRLILTSSTEKTVRVVALREILDIPVSGAPFRGPEGAEVEIVVFDDFQCPYCARLLPLLEEVHRLYPESVKIVFKNFPLRMHRYARDAAIAGLAAQEQGKFWPLHDKLFANFSTLNEKKIRDLALEVGLDMERFDQSLKDERIAERIERDIQDGLKAGVRGTPAVYVNGQALQDRSLKGFRELIEKSLAKN